MHHLVVAVDQKRQNVDELVCVFASQMPMDLVAQRSVESLDYQHRDGLVLGAKLLDASSLQNFDHVRVVKLFGLVRLKQEKLVVQKRVQRTSDPFARLGLYRCRPPFVREASTAVRM